MKIISFNANGIRSAATKGFFEWMHSEDPDVVCLQETKAQATQLMKDPIFHPEQYYCQYVDAEKKGYSGVAIFSKKKPMNVVRGAGFELCDVEGRYLQFDYPGLSVVSLYLPSGTSGEHRQAVKFEFLERFTEHLLELKAQGRALIICGDYNIAHKKIDLKNWQANQKNSGFLPEERAWMDKLFGDLGFHDAFRVVNQEEGQYTWWTYRAPQAFKNNVGWRLDYQVISEGLLDSVRSARVYREKRMSDHAPLLIEYEGEYFA